ESLSVDPLQGALILSPSAAPRFHIQEGFQALGAQIDRSALEAALATMLGGSPRAPLRFERRLQTNTGAGASVLAILRFLMQEVDRTQGAMTSPIVSKTLTEAFLYNLLRGQPHNHSALLHAPAPTGERHYVQ